MRTVGLAVILAAILPVTMCEAAGKAPSGPSSGLCEKEIEGAAKRNGIPVAILYSVGLTETGNRGSLYPWALNIEGRAVFPASKAAALVVFREAKAEGKSLIDVGCMQVNHHFHGNRFTSVEEMFDPPRNIDYAARFLRQLFATHGSWSMAVARYHAGPDNNPAQKRYICRVIANMVAVDYGKWTENARTFCKPGSATPAKTPRVAEVGG
jgi:soluble lytic murein transglycosylase-like protein